MEENDELPVVEQVYYLQHGEKEEVSTDVFAKDGEFVKSLSGVSSNSKRRITNKLNKRHSGAGGAESKKEETNEITGYNAFDVALPPYNLDYLARLYEMSSPHYSACNAKVSNIVGLGFTLVETLKTKRVLEDISDDRDKTEKFTRKMNRAREDLLEKIDSWHEDDTFTQTLIKVWRDYEATGNAYIEVGRTNRGDVGYVGHVPSTTVRIRKRRDGFVQIISNKAVYFRNFGDTTTADPIGDDSSPNELIHLMKYSPTNGFYGVPDIVAAKIAVAGNEFSARYNLDYFENKAMPRHVITLKGAKLGSGALTSLMELFEGGIRGTNHRSVFLPLPADSGDRKVELKIDAVESGVQDSSFNNYRKANLNDILMAHRVPLSKISVSEGVSLASARDADKTFKEQVCQPEQKILEKKLNKIISELTDVFYIKLNELTLTDADTQSKIDERAIRNGWRLSNEIRAREGLPPVKGGDSYGGPMTAQKQADARARTSQSRSRDTERSANAPDNDGEARNEQGAGRVQS